MPLRRKLLFALLTLFLALAGAEILARATEARWTPQARVIPPPTPEIQGRDPFKTLLDEARRREGLPEVACVPLPMWRSETGTWSLPPGATVQAPAGHFRGNSMGYRGPEITPKPAGTRRLLTLGDSSIFGDCVSDEEVLSTVAARTLSAQGSPVEAIIGAIPGHDSSQSLSTLHKLGTLVQPDWVVIGNLWSDVFRKDLLPWLDAPEPPPLQALRRVALWRLGRQALAPWLRSREVGYIAGLEDVSTAGAPPRVALATYAANLDAMATLARELGARPVFLALPAPMDLDPAPVPETIARYRLAMAAVARSHDAPLIDGPALFRQEGVPITWFADRIHPAAPAHQRLGEILARVLAQEAPPSAGVP